MVHRMEGLMARQIEESVIPQVVVWLPLVEMLEGPVVASEPLVLESELLAVTWELQDVAWEQVVEWELQVAALDA